MGWYATPKRLASVGLIFQETEFGTFIAHSYRFSPELGTFVIECNPETWRKAGLDRASDEESKSICGRNLQGLSGRCAVDLQPVALVQSGVRHQPVLALPERVLIGDALKTVYPSIGSGHALRCKTRSRLPGARRLRRRPRFDLRVLPTGTQKRRRHLPNRCDEEHPLVRGDRRRMHLDPIPSAYDYMMRTGRGDDERLRRIDPEFAELVERRHLSLSSQSR